jgi:hypothetical protein
MSPPIMGPNQLQLLIGKRLARQMFCPCAKPGATMDRDADGGGIHANNPDCCIHACGHVFIRQSRACRRHVVRVLCLAYELRLLLLRAMPSYCLGQWRILRTESLLGEWRATAQQISAVITLLGTAASNNRGPASSWAPAMQSPAAPMFQ